MRNKMELWNQMIQINRPIFKHLKCSVTYEKKNIQKLKFLYRISIVTDRINAKSQLIKIPEKYYYTHL
jgi:hypothetical protein